jgi:hypothetical protein
MRRTLSGLGFVTFFVLAAGCSNAPDEASGSTTSPVTESAVPAAAASDGCDPASGQARLKATFDRTVDCATDAVSAGLADKVKLAGESVKDTKRIVDVIKGFAGKIGVTNISSARAIMCVRAVSDYTTEETAKNAIKAAAVGLSDAEVDDLWASVRGSFTLGVSEVFAKMRKVDADPTLENLVDFLTTFAGNISTMGELVTTCGSVLAEYGAVSLPSIAAYAERFGQLGVVASIAKCGFAVVGNAIDVGKELSCYGQDLQHLKEQFATLQRLNDARCESFQTFVSDAALLPLLRASGNTSDERRSACYQVIHHWGSCVYGAHRDGNLGSTPLSCDECARVCTGFVNGAGANAYLQPVLDGAYAASGADATDVRRLVFQAAQTCGSDVQPDGLKPCINFCRGQVSDCP